jgi:hypothetical protein
MKFLSLALISLALISLTALVGAQSVSSVVNGLDALTRSFMSLTLSDPIHDVYIVLGYTQYEGVSALETCRQIHAALTMSYPEFSLIEQQLASLLRRRRGASRGGCHVARERREDAYDPGPDVSTGAAYLDRPALTAHPPSLRTPHTADRYEARSVRPAHARSVQ